VYKNILPKVKWSENHPLLVFVSVIKSSLTSFGSQNYPSLINYDFLFLIHNI